MTRDGIARTDILAVGTHLVHRPAIEIQVKTASGTGSKTSWLLGGVTQVITASRHEWFVLILLSDIPQPPRAFVVPRDHVSAATWIVHENRRTGPSAPEGKRNAGLSQARVQLIIWQEYEDRWELLGTPASEVPVLLPDTVLKEAGIQVVLSGVQMPRMNSIMERWAQTCRHELLDRTLIWNQRHLLHALREFEHSCNEHRPTGPSGLPHPCARSPNR